MEPPRIAPPPAPASRPAAARRLAPRSPSLPAHLPPTLLPPPAPWRRPQACLSAPEDGADLCRLTLAVGSAGDTGDTLGSCADDCTAAGSLCCAETRDSLEDCSSLGPEEGFVVYQSPLSLEPDADGGSDPGGGGDAAGGPLAPGVLAEQPTAAGQLVPPACDPDLEEMLRWGAGARGSCWHAGAPLARAFWPLPPRSGIAAGRPAAVRASAGVCLPLLPSRHLSLFCGANFRFLSFSFHFLQRAV